MPGDLTTAAASYDGKVVTVKGTVSAFRERTTRGGAVAVFRLCAGACVTVVDHRVTPREDGAVMTLTGIFHQKYQNVRLSFSNVIEQGE